MVVLLVSHDVLHLESGLGETWSWTPGLLTRDDAHDGDHLN